MMCGTTKFAKLSLPVPVRTQTDIEDNDRALTNVVEEMASNKANFWNSIEVFKLYSEFSGTALKKEKF